MMSLLDRPPHKVEVQLMEAGSNDRGMPHDVPVGERIVVGCMVQPVREWATAEEHSQYGLQLLDLRRLFARTWPGDHRSLIYYEGIEYETVGDVQEHHVSPRTRHFAVVLRRRRRDTT